MKHTALPLLLTALLAWLPGTAAASALAAPSELHARHRVPGLEQRVFTAEHWWQRVAPLLENTDFGVETIGHSAQQRPLRHIQWGRGPVHVLLWSQMHGDESTATMALADLLAWLGDDGPDPRRERLAGALSLHLVPILNPDGAARFQRRNAQGIDINRDAAALASPEARALKALRERLQPAYGFNLHDQRPGYRAGDSALPTAIALLAPPAEATRAIGPVRERAITLAAAIASELAPRLPGRLARWDDTFNPRAFGDLMQAWGTSTVLIEAGGIDGDSEKQQLRGHVFDAIVSGLEAIATHPPVNSQAYHRLPFNGEVWPDLLLAGATVHVPGSTPLRADVLVNFEHPLRFAGGRVADIGDLAARPARRRIDATGLHLQPLAGATLALDAPARLRLSRDADGRELVWILDGSLDPDLPDPLPGH